MTERGQGEERARASGRVQLGRGLISKGAGGTQPRRGVVFPPSPSQELKCLLKALDYKAEASVSRWAERVKRIPSTLKDVCFQLEDKD